MYAYSGLETPRPLWTSSVSDQAAHLSLQAPSKPCTPAPPGPPMSRGGSKDPFVADHMDTDSSSSNALALVELMVSKVGESSNRYGHGTTDTDMGQQIWTWDDAYGHGMT
jgi:hypothetical protein